MKKSILIYGATSLGSPEFSADLRWRAGGYDVPDPVAFFEIEGKKILMLSSLEIERGKHEAKVDEVVFLDKYAEKGRLENLPAVVVFLKERKVEEVIVPETLRFSLAKSLLPHFSVKIKERPFYRERAIKTENEIKEIEKAQSAVEIALYEGMGFLKKCLVRGDLLFHTKFSDTPVNSHHLRKIIDDALYQRGYLGVETIVACGEEAADPHSKGYGNLKPREPIVIDIFPRSLLTLYFADQTRTVFKGEPDEKTKRMYNTVLLAQEMAIREVKSGADGSKIEKKVRDFFEAKGYPAVLDKQPVSGFIHSLGHGVGVDIHEEPSISASKKSVLEEGNVVTIEPGLYYHQETETIPRCGIRIEDMILVADKGNRNLTNFPKSLSDMIIE